MVSGACLNTYKATYTSAERTLSSESGHSSCFKKNWGGGRGEVISLPRDAEMLETETEYLLLCVHV